MKFGIPYSSRTKNVVSVHSFHNVSFPKGLHVTWMNHM
jgi:hypothetical protein